MSYILDALKKSEKKRKQGEVPDLITGIDTAQKKTRKKTIWPYLVVIALLVNAMVFSWFGFLSPKKNQKLSDKQHVVKTVQINTDMLKADQNLEVTADAIKESKQNISINEKKDIQSNQVALKNDESSKKNPENTIEKVIPQQHDEPSVSKNSEEAVQGETETKTEVATIPPATDKVYSLSELPLAIQQKLPAFSTTAFIYSEDPVARMVRINGQMMREGDSLSEGPTLEEIVSDGLIFRYQGYRFRVGLK